MKKSMPHGLTFFNSKYSKKFLYHFAFLNLLLVHFAKSSNAQTFILPSSGSQISLGSGCYNITPQTGGSCGVSQQGVIWHSTTVNFNAPFAITFDAKFDSYSGGGADGIVVAFGQNFTTSTGPNGTAGKIGYYGTSSTYTNRSFGIKFDTYDNTPTSHDISTDHISISLNADESTTGTVPGVSPTPINGTAGITDNVSRTYTITWDPLIPQLKIFMGTSPCVLLLSSNYDFRTVFTTGGMSNIRWGITSGTGGGCSNHIICNATQVIPVIATVYDTACSPGPITLSGPSGYANYSWSSGVTTSTISVSTSGTYTVTAFNDCEVVKKIFHITIHPTPVITGILQVCVGSTTTLTSITGGSWTSVNPSVGTINTSTGVFNGLSTGTSTVSYVMPSGCMATVVVTVHPMPASIIGTSTLCQGETTILTSSTTGGSWSSSNTAVATIGSSGLVTAVGVGTTIITYDFTGTGCYQTMVFTVHPMPATIIGAATLCQGETTTLSNSVSGGSWSSSNTAVATIGTSGLVTAIGIGTTIITYDFTGTGCYKTKIITVNGIPIININSVCVGDFTTPIAVTYPGGTWSVSPSIIAIMPTTSLVYGVGAGTAILTYTAFTGCTSTVIFTVNPLPAVITASSTIVCQGSTINLYNSTPSGTWSSMHPIIATVASSTGVVTGVSDGTAVIQYILDITGCRRSEWITVVGIPTGIIGDSVICTGENITLTPIGSSGGTWSSSTPTVGSIGSSTGILTGNTSGTTIVTYTRPTTYCPAISVTKIVTVNPTPAAITGTFEICLGDTTILSNSVSGGTWQSDNTSIATIGSASGVVIGISSGIVNITYTIMGECSITATLQVNPPLDPITGDTSVCTGFTSSLFSGPSGGTWSSSNPAIATIDALTGVITGVTAGSVIVTYSLGTGCLSMAIVHIYTSPAAIIGDIDICELETSVLTNTITGGVWSSGSPTIATIATDGTVTGIVAGTTFISYTMPGSCVTTTIVTVHPIPNLSGTTVLCTGNIVTLTSDIAGVWTSTLPTVATIGSATGIVSGLTSGTTTISFVSIHGCVNTLIVTVNETPASITGPFDVCVGNAIVLTESTPGGVWSSASPSIATIATDGTVTGISSGTAIISYTLATGCFATTIVTVHPIPNLSGTTVLCTGDVVTLTSDVAGVWTSTVPTVATIGSATGILAGLTAGTTIISFVSTYGCVSTLNVTVNETPAPIGGPFNVCRGYTIVLTESTTGGTWSSASPTIATIATDGTVTGVSPGTAIISYTVATGCFAIAIVTVNPLPTIIDGTYNACVNDSVLLIASPVGGTWSSADISTATVNPSTGYVTGVSAGTVTISYTLSTGCYITSTVTVHPLPSPIIGPSSVCIENIITLSNATPGGFWSGSSPGIANFDPATQEVVGISAGTIMVTYRLFSTGCYVTHTVTVNPVPSGILGDRNICEGATGTLTSTPSGGTWISVTPSVATINPSTGDVFGVSVGSSVITYMLSTGCYQLSLVRVHPIPTPIIGVTQMCVNDTATLYSTPTGGYWVSDAPWVATVDAISGLWTSISGGTATITYVGNPLAGCFTTVVVTVGPIIAPLAFTDSDDTLCIGDTTSFSHPTAGGVWDISNYDIASWTPSGPTGIVVTGISAGTVTISYTITDTCGITTVTRTINVIGIPNPTISGILGVCDGYTTTLTGSPSGGTWVSSNPSVASIDATGVVTGVVGGGSVTISYTATNVCGSRIATTNVLVNMEPYITTNFISACQFLSGSSDAPNPIISGHGVCIKVCDSSIVRYYANGVSGSAFTWDIIGGTVITDYGDSIDVMWTTVGLTGSVVVHDTFHHCIDSAAACITVIDKPDAQFSVIDSSFCVESNIVFTDLSVGDPSSPILYWHWDFGDGSVLPSVSSASVEHAYENEGTYTVTLTVKNQCNCTDSFKKVIKISKFKSPLIVCPAVVCENEYASYKTNGECRTFVWTVSGGNFFFDTASGAPIPGTLDPTGTILTESTGTVTVHWNNVDSTGFGYLTLLTPGCSLCESPTTLKIPVIKQTPKIQGLDTICTNTQVAYSLPLWPATNYKWGVLGNPYVIPLCKEDNKVVVSFPVAGTYTLHGTYQNKIKLCGGDVYKVITVLPPSSIIGAVISCNESTETYTMSGGYSAQWTVKDHLGNILTSSLGLVSSFPFFLPSPGIFFIEAEGDFCADPITLRVYDVPPIPDNIIGKDTICLRRPYTYKAFSDVPGTIFSWEAIGGTVVPVSGLNTVTVNWYSTGTKQLKVRRISTSAPFCEGLFRTLDITHEIVNPVVTGDTTPCANSTEIYSANYTRGESYEWMILPNTSGSVISGLRAPNAQILWNNVTGITTASVIVTVTKCDSIKRDTLVVNISGGPAIELLSISNDTVCSGERVDFTVSSGGDSYFWRFGDGSSASTGISSFSNWYPKNHTTSYVAYPYTIFSDGGCTSPTGSVTGFVYVKPGINVVLSASNYSPCTDSSVLITATTSSNVSLSSFSWFGSTPPIPISPGVVGILGSTTVKVVAFDSNGCSDTASIFIPFVVCDTIINYCPVPTTITSTCNAMTLFAGTPGSPQPGYWVPVNHTFTPSAGNPATVNFPKAGIYEFYFRDTIANCRTSTKTGKIYATSDYAYSVLCSTTPGMYDISLATRTTYLPELTSVGLSWDDVTTPSLGFATTPYTLYNVPAGSVVDIGHTITGTIPSTGGSVSCYSVKNIAVPVALSVAFTYSVSPICERLPISFTPVVTGSGLQYYWDFDDGSSLILANGKREYTFSGVLPGPDFWDVKLRVKDNAGCMDSAINTVDIYRNPFTGDLGMDTTVCSGDAPYTLSYTPFGTSPMPLSYLWSTSETTPTISINESGAYWVKVTGLWQCEATMPKDSAVKVRIIQTPPAVIKGARHYCSGDKIYLNGYAGDNILYQWYVDGVATTAPGNYPTASWVSYEDTFTVQLRLRVYDSLTSRYCDVYSPIDTIRVYPLPAPPTITGPVAVDCDLYKLQLIASAPVSGTYNWVGLPAGPVANINVGGPYKVWFTDLRGCKSSENIYVPLDPSTYKPYFPNGCYEVCSEQLPITLYGPPCTPFDTWDWRNSTGTILSGTGVMLPLDITVDETYSWRLNNGLCTKKIGNMDLTSVSCNKCQGVLLNATLLCEPDSPSSYSITVNFNTTYPNMNYVIGTDIGPITPFTGSITTAGAYTANLKFTTMYRDPLPDSVTVQLLLTTIDGRKCYEEVTIGLDSCSWIAERSGGDVVPVRPIKQPIANSVKSITALLVFPNPALTDINVQYNYGEGDIDMRSLSVYDAMGRKIAQTIPNENNGSWMINATEWTSGMYIIRMEGDGKVLHTQRVIITH